MRGGTNTQEIYKPKYLTFTCDNVDEIRDHINKHKSIYLHGLYGKGKTHFLYFLARYYNEQGHSIYLLESTEFHFKLIDEINLNKSTGSIVSSIRQKMKEVDLLFIDDMGAEKMTEFVHEALMTIIDYRYRNEKPTFISSNYTQKQLHELWEQKIGNVKTGQLIRRIQKFGEVELKGKRWWV